MSNGNQQLFVIVLPNNAVPLHSCYGVLQSSCQEPHTPQRSTNTTDSNATTTPLARLHYSSHPAALARMRSLAAGSACSPIAQTGCARQGTRDPPLLSNEMFAAFHEPLQAQIMRRHASGNAGPQPQGTRNLTASPSLGVSPQAHYACGRRRGMTSPSCLPARLYEV